MAGGFGKIMMLPGALPTLFHNGYFKRSCGHRLASKEKRVGCKMELGLLCGAGVMVFWMNRFRSKARSSEICDGAA